MGTTDLHRSNAWLWPFVLAIVASLVCAGLAIRQYYRFATANATVERTYQVIDATDQVVARLVDAENSQRGYLLTSDPRFLQGYRGVHEDVAQLMKRLQSLVAGNPALRQLALELSGLADQRQAEMAKVLRLFDDGDPTATSDRVSEGSGLRLMDSVRAVAAKMRATEVAFLASSANEALAARRAAIGFGIWSIIMALALGIVAVSVRRNFDRREAERTQLLASERAARSEAERATRIKDDFVSTLSHELRTPLNAILGWTGVLRQDRRPETLRRAIEVIDRNCRRQSQMVEDLLDLGRISAGKLRLDVQRVDVESVIEEAVASAQPAAGANGVRLTRVIGSPAIIQGDPGRLQQVVWNLLSNAIKFTPRGGRVRVLLHQVDSQIAIVVSDTGQGIPAHILPHVFERFRQADSSVSGQEMGLGLGLAIVKNLVEMHGGTVQAESPGQGQGSTFTVTLPPAPVDMQPAESHEERLEPEPAPVAGLLTSVVVLVLDDENDGREVVQRLLESAGAVVWSAASADDAIEKLQAGFIPDLILSDISMPGQDGYEFIRRVRHLSGQAAGVPAAALTALARSDDRKRALLAGYQTHLSKPVDPGELVATVASLTGRTGRIAV